MTVVAAAAAAAVVTTYLGQSREKGFNLGPRLQAREVPLWGDAVVHVNHVARLELGGLHI
jgi:hypothetical protein